MADVAAFGFAPFGQVTLSFKPPQLLAGAGVHLLRLPFEAVVGWLDEQSGEKVPLLLAGRAWFESGQIAMRWTGAIAPQTVVLRGYSTQEELSISLTDGQVIAIDELRGPHGDVSFRLDLSATWLTPPAAVHPTVSYQFCLRLSEAAWLHQLNQIGTETSFLIRVPSPLSEAGVPAQEWAASAADRASRTQAASRLRQAEKEFHDGDYEQCVATCRRVLENYKRLTPVPALNEVTKVRSEDRKPQERWAMVYHALVGLTHPAHHDDLTTRLFTWTRSDAQAVLAAVSSLVARLP